MSSYIFDPELKLKNVILIKEILFGKILHVQPFKFACENFKVISLLWAKLLRFN